jgi:hypothetical protein
MKKIYLLILLISSISFSCSQNVDQQITSSREATQQLANELKLRLKSALQTSGPLEAISVCNLEAQNIGTKVSKQLGMSVGRTSLKLRNTANAPDDWETKQLHYFQEQFKVDSEDLEVFDIISDNEGKWFRYMKTIPVGEVCLLCHGDVVAEPLKHKIESLYPSDQAIGYRKGELRGAFTVKQAL